ncbi:MAG: ATP-binding protein [Anaerolineae bacterium]|jgi:signal transduction histidine kinase|nr:ATP-binding protein [Anaerolineae bacterium]
MCANRTQSLSILFEAGSQLSQSLDLDQIYMTMHDLLTQAMDCDELIVAGYDAATEMITCEFYYSWAKEANVDTMPSMPVTIDGSSAQSKVILTGESMLIPNYHLFSHNDTAPFHPRGRQNTSAGGMDAKNLEVRSAVVIPMKLDGVVVGVVQIFSYRYNAYSEREYHLAETLTAQMVVARNNAFLYQQATEELRQRELLQHQLEEERNQLEKRVQERTAELQTALKVRDTFLANMSHELRTPLTSILGMSELLQYQIHGKLTDKQNRFVDLIFNNSEHLMHLLNDLIDMSRIATGEMKAYKEWVPMDSIIQSCTHYARLRAEEKNINVFTENHTRIDRIYVDPQRTKQVLNNILNNAIKFTPKGLSIGFEVMFSFDQRQLEFLIWDQGGGISDEDQKKMTEPFEVGKEAVESGLGGAGLGLALARTLTEIQGGKIIIDTKKEHGTLVTVRLPYNSDEPDSGRGNTMQVTPERTDLLREMVSSMKDKRILIADEDENLCELLTNYLEIFEVESILVHDMKSLVSALQATPPDLLMVDLNLPGTDNMEKFLYRLRNDKRFLRMPILGTCAIHRMPDTGKLNKLSVSDFLRKPFSFTDVGTKIRKYLI